MRPARGRFLPAGRGRTRPARSAARPVRGSAAEPALTALAAPVLASRGGDLPPAIRSRPVGRRRGRALTAAPRCQSRSFRRRGRRRYSRAMFGRAVDARRDRRVRRPRARRLLAPLRRAHAHPAAVARGGAGGRARGRLGGGARVRARAATPPATSSSPCPRRAGREGAPTVILQGHLDMVCEREPDSPYDPREGRIDVVRDGDWLRAEGTTLGADDGVAIAAMLALAEDAAAPHGPLELLMTVAEEVGLAGAQALDPALITGDAAAQPRQRGGRHAHGRLRGQRGPRRALRRAARRSPPDADARCASPSRGGPRRPLRRRHRARAARTRSSCSPDALRGAREVCASPRSTAARAATRSRATRSRSWRATDVRAAIEAEAARIARRATARTDPGRADRGRGPAGRRTRPAGRRVVGARRAPASLDLIAAPARRPARR